VERVLRMQFYADRFYMYASVTARALLVKTGTTRLAMQRIRHCIRGRKDKQIDIMKKKNLFSLVVNQVFVTSHSF
jgi:hypothetical protein